MDQIRVNPSMTLEAQGIVGVGTAHYNETEADLVARAIVANVHGPFAQGQAHCQDPIDRKQRLVGKQCAHDA
jgi:hypothetical protein